MSDKLEQLRAMKAAKEAAEAEKAKMEAEGAAKEAAEAKKTELGAQREALGAELAAAEAEAQAAGDAVAEAAGYADLGEEAAELIAGIKAEAEQKMQALDALKSEMAAIDAELAALEAGEEMPAEASAEAAPESAALSELKQELGVDKTPDFSDIARIIPREGLQPWHDRLSAASELLDGTAEGIAAAVEKMSQRGEGLEPAQAEQLKALDAGEVRALSDALKAQAERGASEVGSVLRESGIDAATAEAAVTAEAPNEAPTAVTESAEPVAAVEAAGESAEVDAQKVREDVDARYAKEGVALPPTMENVRSQLLVEMLNKTMRDGSPEAKALKAKMNDYVKQNELGTVTEKGGRSLKGEDLASIAEAFSGDLIGGDKSMQDQFDFRTKNRFYEASVASASAIADLRGKRGEPLPEAQSQQMLVDQMNVRIDAEAAVANFPEGGRLDNAFALQSATDKLKDVQNASDRSRLSGKIRNVVTARLQTLSDFSGTKVRSEERALREIQKSLDAGGTVTTLETVAEPVAEAGEPVTEGAIESAETDPQKVREAVDARYAKAKVEKPTLEDVRTEQLVSKLDSVFASSEPKAKALVDRMFDYVNQHELGTPTEGGERNLSPAEVASVAKAFAAELVPVSGGNEEKFDDGVKYNMALKLEKYQSALGRMIQQAERSGADVPTAQLEQMRVNRIDARIDFGALKRRELGTGGVSTDSGMTNLDDAVNEILKVQDASERARLTDKMRQAFVAKKRLIAEEPLSLKYSTLEKKKDMAYLDRIAEKLGASG